MRVEQLTLENWKGFASLSLDFAPGPFTVLVGRNGAGKSAVVEALQILLSNASLVEGAGRWHPIDTDILVDQQACKIALVTTLGSVEIRKKRSRTSNDHECIGPLVDTLRERPNPTPILRTLSTSRSTFNQVRREEQGVHDFEPTPPEVWAQAFATHLGTFGLAVPWFRREENLENEVRLQSDPDFRRPTLEFVRRALVEFLTHVDSVGCSNPRISRVDPQDPSAPANEGTLVFDKGGVRLTIDQLSDGERFVLLLIFDLARRLSIANADGDALAGPGIVVIDEVEQHLHPGWQSTLLPALHATFPNLQFIVTTHSPLVIASVPGASVRLLHNFQVLDVPPTYGKDANSLLESVFQVSYRPADLVARIRQIESQIDADDLEGARSGLDRIATTLSTEDPDVVRLRTLLEFLGS